MADKATENEIPLWFKRINKISGKQKSPKAMRQSEISKESQQGWNLEPK